MAQEKLRGVRELGLGSTARMKASIKSKYEAGAAAHGAVSTLSFGVGDLRLKASCTDSTFANGGSSLQGVSLGVEKPGSFIIDYNLQSRAARFQFMNASKVAGKQVKLTYIHPQKANATVFEGTLSFDSRNKFTGKYSFASGKGQLKYTYVHSSDLTLEPTFDFGTQAWNFSASQKFGGNQTVKAVYETQHKVLGIEWINDAKEVGPFKVAASVNLETNKPPKLLLEKTWNYEF